MIDHILVTGGTGKTGRHVVKSLRANGRTPRIATRSPKGKGEVKFQWQDPTTFDEAFQGIQAVYLVAPTDTMDTMEVMQAGLEAAIKAGVKRFVLLSASSLEEGGPMMGAVHTWLQANAPTWAVLRPSWFMQNFSHGQHLASLLDESAIYTATQNGRIGFIDAEDIANCAAVLLTMSEIENTDYILTGPEAISYDGVAEIFSRQLGRTVEHKHLTCKGVAQRFLALGFPNSYANTLATMDDTIAGGSENCVTDNVKALTGRTPTSFTEFVECNANIWKR